MIDKTITNILNELIKHTLINHKVYDCIKHQVVSIYKILLLCLCVISSALCAGPSNNEITKVICINAPAQTFDFNCESDCSAGNMSDCC